MGSSPPAVQNPADTGHGMIPLSGPASLQACLRACTHAHTPSWAPFPPSQPQPLAFGFPTSHWLLLIAQVCEQFTVSNINYWEFEIVPCNNTAVAHSQRTGSVESGGEMLNIMPGMACGPGHTQGWVVCVSFTQDESPEEKWLRTSYERQQEVGHLILELF